MTRLFLIRHGEPSAAWGQSEDPGLSVLGRAQAEAAAARLPGGLAIMTSPMLRCRETAAAYEARLGAGAKVEPRVSEVATPAGLADRRAWLAETFPWRDGADQRDWATLAPGLHRWRADVLAAVQERTQDTAVFSHFIAINAIVGAALGAPQTIVCRPSHASITELALEEGVLRLVSRGEEMQGGDVR
ncbi:MAG TPA: histidine phosphatase family protein [Terricaulis sp.]|nr:histidine phosphatase family protein [Terricaulis sp.]